VSEQPGPQVAAGTYPKLRRAITSLLGENTAYTLGNRLVDYRLWREYTFTSAGRANRAHIRSFKNRHAGGRCIIIGNGPSLRETDLGLLRGEITFGLNRIYLMFDELGFETTYLTAVNELVVEQCAEDFRNIEAPFFTTTPNREYMGEGANAIYLNPLAGPRFVTDVAHGVWVGGTVTYAAMQLAYYMGFSEVILIGVDHRFASKGPANKAIVSTEADQNHFDPRYFGPGFRWQLPDLETSEIAYTLARQKFEKNGRRIIDATVGGALEIFPKSTLETALGK
jgi:hypothetical protein